MATKTTSFFDLVTEIGPTIRLESLLRHIMSLAENLTCAECGSLFLVDEDTNELVFKVVTGPTASRLEGMRVRIGEGVVGNVAQRGLSIIVPDTSTDARFANRFDRSTGFTTRSIIAAPLKIGRRVIGVLELVNKKQGRFAASDLELLKNICDQAALIIENAKLVAQISDIQHYWENLLQDLPIGIMVLSTKGMIYTVNKTAAEILNLNVKQLLGKSFASYWREKEHLGNFLDSISRTKRVWETEDDLRGADGQVIPVSLVGNRIPGGIELKPGKKEKGVIVVFRDLSQSLELSRLKQVDRMKSTFIANVSHELRGPLTPILGFSELLTKAKSLSPREKEFAEIIRDKAKDLQIMIERLLNFSKIEMKKFRLKTQKLDLYQILKELAEEKKIEADFEFRISVQGTIPRAAVDVDLIRVALEEIYDNAIKFSPQGGVIKTRLVRRGRNIVLSVTDQGIGIPKEEMANVFKKFSRLEDVLTGRTKGLGVGLATVQHIIDLHGGKIEILSRVGKGTKVLISLPLGASRQLKK